MIMPMKKDSRALAIKVIFMLLALIGVFWARSALQKSVQTQEAPQAPIPAKVEFGK